MGFQAPEDSDLKWEYARDFAGVRLWVPCTTCQLDGAFKIGKDAILNMSHGRAVSGARKSGDGTGYVVLVPCRECRDKKYGRPRRVKIELNDIGRWAQHFYGGI